MHTARVMFLEIELPDDDPLAPAKRAVNTTAPGFRLHEKSNRIEWESDFVWLIAINEEDGLDFKLKQTTVGETTTIPPHLLPHVLAYSTYLQQMLTEGLGAGWPDRDPSVLEAT
jgi:hypothetical protein